jgi:hypothetical protein
VGDGKLNINGNGSWAYQRTSENRYLQGDSDGDYETSMFDLVLTGRPADDIVLAAQLGFDSEAVELEWAFAEYRFSDAARFRVGKVKQPLGNYMELQYVGTARPLYTLATSVYGPANVGATSYSGAGVTGEFHWDSGWAFQYDAYGGAVNLQVYEPFDVLEADYVPPDDGSLPGIEDELAENVFGGRLSLTTPWDVTLRFSSFGGHMDKDEGGKVTYMVYGASLWYRGERAWLSAEAFHSFEKDFEDQVSGYVEAAYFVTPRWQLATRWEAMRTHIEGQEELVSPLLRHDEVAAGVNYWFSPALVVKLSAHQAWGKRFAMLDEGATAGADRTLLLVGGAQFTF